MIVVAIIGLLATMGALRISKVRTESRRKIAETEVALIASAVEKLAWDTGRWPNGEWRSDAVSEDNEIWSLEGSGLDNDGGGVYENWKGPYYEGSYEDPWGNPYFFDSDYRIDGVDTVVVGSFGPNGVGQNIYDSDNVKVPVF